MKAGSWPSIIGIYLFGVCGAATVSKIIPLTSDIGNDFGLAVANFGWLVALIAVPAAIFSLPSGLVVDRLGAKTVLLLAAALGCVANIIYYYAPSLLVVQIARLMEGLAIVHIYTAGPAMLMVSTEGTKRTRAMTLWSTYAPVGTALGLVVGGLFSQSDAWRNTFIVHGILYIAAALLGVLQPTLPVAASNAMSTLKDKFADLGSAFLRPMLLMLAAAFFLMVSMGLGANVTFPNYLASAHHISVHSASTMVASTTLAMILGSLGVGVILPRGIRPGILFACIAVGGLIAGTLCFLPSVSVEARYGALIGWFILTGAALATIMATLPVVADPARPGAAAALINFAGAVATFLNPPLWLGIAATGQWTPFIGLLAIGWTLAVILLWGAILLAMRAKAANAKAQPET